MAKTPWPLALKQVYGTPDFDAVKQRLEEAYKSALNSQETIGALVDTLRAVADGFDGVADQVGGLREQLGDLKHRLERVAGAVLRLDDGLKEVQKDLAEQTGAFGQKLDAVARQAEEQATDLEGKIAEVGRRFGNLPNEVAAHDKELKGLEARVKHLDTRWYRLWCDVHLRTLWVSSEDHMMRGLLRVANLHEPEAVAQLSVDRLTRTLAEQNARARYLEEDLDKEQAAALKRHAQAVLEARRKE
jgi:predicted nuclease with TOPRIM domain